VSAYVDSSCFVAVAFTEAKSESVLAALAAEDGLWSSPLLEAELRAALRREEVETDASELLGGLQWVIPERALSAELARVFAAGRPRGADAWHLATALWLAPDPGELTFLTLDRVQRDTARALGFRVGAMPR
jgi:predicted nucleic acid-binding protein